ncbi:MAG TPA: metallophosphoesterase [Terriglobales bacterium]|nr:metallophosphoesterase [Terriglobales bacterium]
MRIEIVHLSDIHFRKAGNPLLKVVDQLVLAVNSVDPSASLFLVVVSGDIAYSGQPAEYKAALDFFREFREKLAKLRADAVIEFVSVPGNHDCVLPEKGVKLRRTLVEGVIPSMQEPTQDEELFAQLRKAQAPYNKFRRQLGRTGEWDSRCETVVIDHQDKKIQLNLYNTALLSQHKEKQGQLHLPLKSFEEHISLGKDSSLCISVFHHSYLWLDSEVAVTFRAHIEKTSDIALSGHQHHAHEFYKQNSTGERILYLEAPALQDKDYPKTSQFRVLLLDWETMQEKVVMFRRSRDMYSRAEESELRPLAINRAIRAEFRLSEKFEDTLNECGTLLRHKVKGLLKMRDIFVFPDLLVRPAGAKSRPREVRGSTLLSYVTNARRIIFQCPALGGKTSLARTLLWEIVRSGSRSVPILLRGYNISSIDEGDVLSGFWKTFSQQYSREMLEAFQQLSKEDRTLIVDDWHRSDLSSEGRREYLALASKYFDRILLFTDELFQIHELLSGSADSILEFDHATVAALNQDLRGQLIDKWVTLGRVQTGDSREMNREIEIKERLIRSMIGKNTLPSRPFFVLCLLQADEQEKAKAAEAGSFGYLYEVLVTTALSVSKGKAQLDKKYNFLSLLAYTMFKDRVKSMPLSRVKEIAKQYSEAKLVTVDFAAMLSDLELARVLINIDGNYSFEYPHLFYYFIARYYRDNLGRDVKLRAEIEHMADYVSSDEYASILMFTVYFARDSSDIVKRLVANADQIYSREVPANLDTDVVFLNQLCDHPDVEVPEQVDIKRNRQERRELADRIERSAAELGDRRKQGIAYSDGLSDSDKFDLAYRHIGLLGQVIRNFPGSLPGPDKLAILTSTYMLGLRVLRVLLTMLGTTVGGIRQGLAEAATAQGKTDPKKARELIDFLILLICRMCTLSVLSRVASSVGAADLEEAYRETLEIVGRSNASELINLTIKLEHLTEFPTNEIRELHKEFSNNAFADTILADIVVGRLNEADIDRRTRQSIASVFKLTPNALALMAPGPRKS